MNIQPVVHLDPGGQTAKGRWRAFAMFGGFGGGATWAEGAYEMGYVKQNGVWKIKTLDYHSGFGASYATGWAPPEPQPEGAAAAPRGPRNLAASGGQGAQRSVRRLPGRVPGDDALHESRHDGRRPRLDHRRPCPRTRVSAPTRATAPRISRAARRISRTSSRSRTFRRSTATTSTAACGTRSRTCSPTTARSRWGCAACTSARRACAQFLNLLGPAGIKDGELFDHVQLQVVVDVADDGRTAKSRSRELNMIGVVDGEGTWSEGIYENTWVKDNGVWKLKDLRYFPTFISDYDQGWAKDAKPVPTASTELPPDRPPTSTYAIYPKAHIPPFHYDNPVSGLAPRYPASARPPGRRGDRGDSRERRRRQGRTRAAAANERRRRARRADRAAGRPREGLPRDRQSRSAATAITSTRISGPISRTCSPSTARSSSRSAACTSAASACAACCSTCSARKARRRIGSATTCSGSP